MRRVFLGLLAVVAAMLVVVPAPPAAAAATGITISGPASVASGGTATITGRLASGRTFLSGETMFLNKSLDGVSWTFVGITSTGSDGNATLNATNLTVTTRFRWSYPGDAEAGYEPSTSPIHTVSVASDPGPTQPTLTIGGPDGVASGGSAEISTQMTRVIPPSPEFPGGVVPVSGKTVLLSRSFDGSTWTPVGTAVTDVAGRASRVDSGLTATTRYRWTFAGDAGYLPATSPTHTVLVTGDPGPGDPDPTAISIHTKPAVISTGQSTSIEGVLWSDGDTVSGEEVSLRESTDSGATWTTIATRTTDDDGLAEAVVGPTQNTLYQWRFAGAEEYAWSTSPSAGVTINDEAPTTLTIEVDESPAYQGATVTVSGVLSSAAGPSKHRRVALETSTDGGASFNVVARVVTDGTGTAVWDFTATTLGATSYRWRFEGTPTLGPAVSAPVKVTIKAPEVTEVAIFAPKSISYGSSLDLGARLTSGGAPVVGHTLELYRRVPGEPYAFVTTRVTDFAGQVEVVEQPATNAGYYWRFPGAVGLLESQSAKRDVRVVFRVKAKATTKKVPGGTKITVAGTVAPGLSGEAVELRRLTDTGGHKVLKTGTMIAGQYSFSITVKSGTFRLLVRVPPASGLAAGQSQVMTVKVKGS